MCIVESPLPRKEVKWECLIMKLEIQMRVQ